MDSDTGSDSTTSEEEYKAQPSEEQPQVQARDEQRKAPPAAAVKTPPAAAVKTPPAAAADDMTAAFGKLKVDGNTDVTLSAVFDGYEAKDIPTDLVKASGDATKQTISEDTDFRGNFKAQPFKYKSASKAKGNQMQILDLPIDYYLRTLNNMPAAAEAMLEEGHMRAREILLYPKQTLLEKFHFKDGQFRRIDDELQNHGEEPVEMPQDLQNRG